MKRGRKNLKQGASKQEECQSIAQVASLRGSNQIEIMDAKEENLLALTQQEGIRKRRRGRERGMFQIPPDLVIEILIRLPAKSMVRFKCVSKQWSSLIACRYLCNRLFTVTRRRQQQPHLYMCLLDGGGRRVLVSISPDNNTCCYVVDQDLSIPGIGGFVLNVVRGLMCFSVRKKACIYNPTTRQLLTLPVVKSDITAEQGQKKSSHYYIGHDPINDQYKVFCTIEISSERLTNMKSEHWVFILEAGGSWKKVVVPLENYYPHAPAEAGLFINGVVHYMAWIDMYTCAVVSIDITSEEVTTILVPQKIRDVPLPALMMKADLIEYGGKLAIFNHSYLKDEGLVNLWVLKDAGRNKWSNKRLVLQPCQRHLVHDIDLIVKGTTQDGGKVILVPLEMRSQFYILCYDVQSNDLRKVEIKGVPRLWFNNRCSFDLKFMDETCRCSPPDRKKRGQDENEYHLRQVSEAVQDQDDKDSRCTNKETMNRIRLFWSNPVSTTNSLCFCSWV